MSGAKRSPNGDVARKGLIVHPKAFFFFDKRTGTPRFEVQAGPNGKIPVDQAVSLLAVNCLARGQMPKDFRVMVAADENLIEDLAPRAKLLMRSCFENSLPVKLTGRQEQVLKGILRNLSNKEIAAELKLSLRTVKFHVSTLLEKFTVSSRVDLMREATEILSSGGPSNQDASSAPASDERGPKSLERDSLNPRLLRLSSPERRSAKPFLWGH